MNTTASSSSTIEHHPAPPPLSPSNPLLHWSQSAYHAHRTPIILKLSQAELDGLLTSHGTATKPLRNSPNLAPNPYGPPNPVQDSRLHSVIQATLNSSEYDALGLPLTNPDWRSRWESLCVDQPIEQSQDQLQEFAYEAEHWRRSGCFLASELNLHNTLEVTKCVCLAAEWLELDAAVEGIRFDCELALKQELSYATYLNVSHLIIPPIRNRRFISDYGRAICSVLGSITSSVVLSIAIPISDPEKALVAWEDWHTLRKLCGYHPRLNITLVLSNFGGAANMSELIAKWAAEPLGFIWIPATTFISNAKQYPVLSKSCQTFMKAMFKYKPSIILSETLESKHSSGGPLAYVQYVRFIEKKATGVPNDPIENFAAEYLDYLQAPLQPLADNLDSQVYEGFEKDPVKYSKYEEAIYQALCDRPAEAVQSIAVCGAGRGPLVEAALRAARRSGRTINLTAVEKNPNSYLTLQERLSKEWDEKIVQLWFGDMRDYQPIEPIDLIISELLGSFGDNELSPECLDGVIRWLAADGISIPSSYCSFLAPLSASKIHSRVLELGKCETPYVVMIHAAQIISDGANDEMSKVQETWSFDHPRTDLVFSPDTGVPITNFHNARSSHLTFHIPQPSICHGLAGYFRATLYGTVTIETHPESRMSREMLSWFPMFFPLKEPIYCPKNSELDVHLWRLTDQIGRKVWYEWAAEAFMHQSESNKGRTSSLGHNTDPALLEDQGAEEVEEEEEQEVGRVKIAVSTLHNVLGRESRVKS